MGGEQKFCGPLQGLDHEHPDPLSSQTPAECGSRLQKVQRSSMRYSQMLWSPNAAGSRTAHIPPTAYSVHLTIKNKLLSSRVTEVSQIMFFQSDYSSLWTTGIRGTDHLCSQKAIYNFIWPSQHMGSQPPVTLEQGGFEWSGPNEKKNPRSSGPVQLKTAFVKGQL